MAHYSSLPCVQQTCSNILAAFEDSGTAASTMLEKLQGFLKPLSVSHRDWALMRNLKVKDYLIDEFLGQVFAALTKIHYEPDSQNADLYRECGCSLVKIAMLILNNRPINAFSVRVATRCLYEALPWFMKDQMVRSYMFSAHSLHV